MRWGWIVVAIALGVFLPLQPLINAELRRSAGGSGFFGASVNNLVGLVGVIVCWLAFKPEFPSVSSLGAAPWWSWTGGLIGGAFVVLTLLMAPKLGVVLMFSLMLVSQMISSLVVDHFGIANAPVREATFMRIAGVALVILGVVFVQLGTQSTPSK
ncbi:MAG: DMT family transporter [Planctomycetota bacterium]